MSAKQFTSCRVFCLLFSLGTLLESEHFKYLCQTCFE